MGTNFSQQTMQTSITEHEYRVEALQKRIKELENENQKLKDNGNIKNDYIWATTTEFCSPILRTNELPKS